MQHKLHIVTYALAAIVAFIAIRIEVLNTQAGGMLPNREYRNSDPKQGVVTWRHSPVINERLWRRFLGPRDANGEPVTRPLTASDKEQMRQDIRRGRANNRLLGFVETAGVLQYLLVPVLFVLSLVLLARRKPSCRGVLVAALPLCVSIAACAFMLYRAYFPSLGN